MNDFCAATGMKLLPYGVVAGGFLGDAYLVRSPPFVPLFCALAGVLSAGTLGAPLRWLCSQRHGHGPRHQ